MGPWAVRDFWIVDGRTGLVGRKSAQANAASTGDGKIWDGGAIWVVALTATEGNLELLMISATH